MEDNRLLDEIYDAICKRYQERYAEQGKKTPDEEVKKAAGNLFRFCSWVVEL